MKILSAEWGRILQNSATEIKTRVKPVSFTKTCLSQSISIDCLSILIIGKDLRKCHVLFVFSEL